jgi:hypothetical protein|tara:strand:- start:79 stop:327 length:249 start_codon:yes stop_codon:yes gene_type:complete
MDYRFHVALGSSRRGTFERVLAQGGERLMTVGELKHRLLEGIGSHNDDDEAVIYDQETGERYDILIVDDTIDGEIQLNIEVK